MGTTFTAAAVAYEHTVEMVGLGNRALQIPSVLFLNGQDFLVGEPAERRGATEPARLVREFKRRLGDHVPVLVGGSPFSAETLMAKVLSWVIERTRERMGESPSELVLTHPANWGPYKLDVFRQVMMLASVDQARLCPEPSAAAAQYAARAAVEVGQRLAIFDFGGGTFDACVLERTGTGFSILGTPAGVEHLGGADLDEAIFREVLVMAADRLTDLDPGDLDTTIALARLRRDCVEAKEALSSDVEAVVPISISGLSFSVRLTRRDLEHLIRPVIGESLAALRRALASAAVTPDDLTSIVMVGGSSRIPLVVEMLEQEFGRPTAVDTHPKHDVALGAARLAFADRETNGWTAARSVAPPVEVVPAPPPAPTAKRSRRGSTGARAVRAPRTPPAEVQGTRPAEVQGTPTAELQGSPSPEVQGSPPAKEGSATPAEVRSPPRTEVQGTPPPGLRTTPLVEGPSTPPAEGPTTRPAASTSTRRIKPVQVSPVVPDRSPAPDGRQAPGRSEAPSHPEVSPSADLVGAVAPVSGVDGATSAPKARKLSPDPLGATSSKGLSRTGGRRVDRRESARQSLAPNARPRRAVTIVLVIAAPIIVVVLFLAWLGGAFVGAPRALPTSAPLTASQLLVPMKVTDNWDIYLADTTVQAPVRRVTTGPGSEAFPVLSPDLRSMVYILDPDNALGEHQQLRVAAADGHGDEPFFDRVPADCTGRMRRPGWNRADATQLAVPCVDSRGTSHLLLMDTSGRIIRRLAEGPERLDDPSFSPDGGQVVFWKGPTSGPEGGSLFVVSSAGGPVRQLTFGSPGQDADATWSPDGSTIAFRRRDPNGTEGGRMRIYVTPADGSGQPKAITSTAADSQDPTWASSGQALAYRSSVHVAAQSGPDVPRVWLMNKDGTDKNLLWTTGATGMQSAPSWSAR